MTPPPSSGDADAVTLLIVIVNYRTAALTIDCLESVSRELASLPDTPGTAGIRVVVADNCSPDDSLSEISGAIAARGWQPWCHAFRTALNGGFSYGNNRAIDAGVERWGRPRFILHLNSDTIVHPGCLARCVDVMERDPTIGVLTCRLLNTDGTNQSCARRFPSPARLTAIALGLPWYLPAIFRNFQIEYHDWRSPPTMDVDWVAGAFLLMRGDAFRRLGGLSEQFFFYGEDIELCARVWRAGLRVRYQSDATITHFGGGSSDPTRMAAQARSTLAWKGRYLVLQMVYGRPAAWLVRVVDTLTTGARLVLMPLLGRRSSPQYQVIRSQWSVLRRPLRA